MRKLFFVVSIMLLLSGCGLAPDGPETVQADNKTVRTGFYGDLYPNAYALTEETLQADGLTLVRIANDTFELYHADVGPYAEGAVYCEESQYAQASAYYSDPANYRYYCILGADTSDEREAQTIELPDVDPAVFDGLLRFAEQSSYDPFDDRHNAEVETVELPMPDDRLDTPMVFYKESSDALFCSTRGSEYYIIDGALYLVYRYDLGHGKYEKLIAVKAPEDISAYFVSLMGAVEQEDVF